MALIHSLSTPSIRGEVDLFSIPPTDTTAESSFYTEYKPTINIMDSDAKLEFRITGNSNQFIDIYDHFLHVTIKVVNGDGSDLKDNDVSTCNNLLHSLFQQPDIYLNNKLISNANHCYAYKAFFETLFSYNKEGMETSGACSLFFKDTQEGVLDDRNDGYKRRKDYISSSKIVELVGKLRLDIASQQRYILNDTNLCISLTRNSDEFCLLWEPSTAASASTLNPKIKFLDASLFVRKHVLYPSISLSVQKHLQNGLSAHYPLMNSDVKQFTIPSGNQSFIEENVFMGNVPGRIIMGLVSNAAFNGDYKLNPFIFQHFNINYVSLTVNNIPIPMKAMILDFKKQKCLLPYYLMLTSLGLSDDKEGSIISRDEFSKGYTFFAYDLNHSQRNDSALVLENSGSVRIELRFGTALAEAVNLLVYFESQGVLTIDKFKQPTLT